MPVKAPFPKPPSVNDGKHMIVSRAFANTHHAFHALIMKETDQSSGNA